MLKNITYLFALFIVMQMISSCASTETTSFSDPDFLGINYSKICIYADFKDLKEKQKMEDEFVKNYSKQGIYAIAGYKVFPPTREWDEEQIQQVLMNQGIGGYLLISLLDKKIDETYTPGKTVTETKGITEKKGNKSVYRETTVTKQDEGSTTKNYFSSFEAKLIDVKSRKNAWMATSTSTSGEWGNSGFDLIFESYSGDIVDKMIQDRKIIPNKK
jgi:hypothetical protein